MRILRRWRRARTLGVVAGLLLAAPARAFEIGPADDPEAGGQTLAVEREIVALTVVGASAAFENRLGLADDPPDAALPCNRVPPGFTMLVGRFDEPTELALALTTPDGHVWRLGPGSDNADMLPHARLSLAGPDTVLVEWEDLPSGGDVDYDDCVVQLRISPAVP
jgi:hypothetical protein